MIKLAYKKHLDLKSNNNDIYQMIKIGKQSLKDVCNHLNENYYKLLKTHQHYIEKNIKDVTFYENKVLDKLSTDRVLIFNDLLEQTTCRSEVLKTLSNLLDEKMTFKICDKDIDVNNIDYSLYDDEINKTEKELDYLKKEKKIKLKELKIIKNNIERLSYYVSFIKSFGLESPVLNNLNCNKTVSKKMLLIYFITDKTKRNISLLNLKYSKKFSKSFIEDEIKYQMYVMEKNKLKDEMKELNKKISTETTNFEYYSKLKNEILSLKDDKCFYKHLKRFFSLNFNNENLINYLHEFYNDENHKFQLTNDMAIHQIFKKMRYSLEEDLELTIEFSKDLNKEIRDIRLHQYVIRNKILNIDFSDLDNEILEFIDQTKEKVSFFEENKEILLRAEMNKTFVTWEDSYHYIISKFLEHQAFFKGVVYIFKDSIGIDIVTVVLDNIDKKYIEIDFDSFTSIIMALKKIKINR
jgi:hypothetical protein